MWECGFSTREVWWSALNWFVAEPHSSAEWYSSASGVRKLSRNATYRIETSFANRRTYRLYAVKVSARLLQRFGRERVFSLAKFRLRIFLKKIPL